VKKKLWAKIKLGFRGSQLPTAEAVGLSVKAEVLKGSFDRYTAVLSAFLVF